MPCVNVDGAWQDTVKILWLFVALGNCHSLAKRVLAQHLHAPPLDKKTKKGYA